MIYPVVQKKPPNSIPPTSAVLDRVVKCSGVWLTTSHDLAVLHSQFRVTVTGTPQPIFQPQALVTGFHIWLPPALWTSPRILEQAVGRECYGDLLAVGLVQRPTSERSGGTPPCCSVDADISNFAPRLTQRQ